MCLWYQFTNVAQIPLQPVLWPLLHTVQARNAERHLTNYCNVIPHADMVGPKVRTGDNMKKRGSVSHGSRFNGSSLKQESDVKDGVSEFLSSAYKLKL